MSTTSAPKSPQVGVPDTDITKQALVAGDIIATRPHNANYAVTYAGTGETVSHAILYTGGSKGMQFAVDAVPQKGVCKETLLEKLKQVSYAAVFRHRTATAEQCARACAWAEIQALVHKPYDYQSAVRAGNLPYTTLGRLIIISDEASAMLSPQGKEASFMCSELVFRAFEIAGVSLIDKPAYCMSPASLFHTDKLECLGRLV